MNQIHSNTIETSKYHNEKNIYHDSFKLNLKKKEDDKQIMSSKEHLKYLTEETDMESSLPSSSGVLGGVTG